jgi:16S rRNA (uracil1498-N3)-methyltransferase
MEEQFPRFIMDTDPKGEFVTLDGEEAHHAMAVLRLRPGDRFVAIDGRGGEYLCSLLRVSDGQVVGEVISQSRLSNEPSVNLTLVMGLPRPAKMDLIVQKVTELGVRRIIPFLTEGTMSQAEPQELKNRLDRWRRIAAESAKQSLRSIVPKIVNPLRLSDLESILSQVSIAFLFEPNGAGDALHELRSTEKVHHEVLAIVGCETGFSRKEMQHFKDLGVKSCSLGKRRLRTETAAVVAVGLILYEMGELS